MPHILMKLLKYEIIVRDTGVCTTHRHSLEPFANKYKNISPRNRKKKAPSFYSARGFILTVFKTPFLGGSKKAEKAV